MLGPAEDLWARVVERASDDAAVVHELTVAPKHRRRPGVWLAAAACLLAVVAVATVVTAGRQSVDTIGPSESPTNPTDGPTLLAHGVGVRLVGPNGGPNSLERQTLDINAQEENGQVTGTFKYYNDSFVLKVEVRVECADTDTGGVVILGGRVTHDTERGGELGEQQVLVINEGNPDRVALIDFGKSGSCADLIQAGRNALRYQRNFVNVKAGSDIETG
jgi:hypothetical protein